MEYPPCKKIPSLLIVPRKNLRLFITNPSLLPKFFDRSTIKTVFPLSLSLSYSLPLPILPLVSSSSILFSSLKLVTVLFETSILNVEPTTGVNSVYHRIRFAERVPSKNRNRNRDLDTK